MRNIFLLALAIAAFLVSSQPARAQDGGDMNVSGQTSSMAETKMDHDKMDMNSHSFISSLLQHATSGTDAEPNSTPFSMLMTTKGKWTLMFHGEGFLSETQQSGPRGGDKLFSTNWWMPMAQRKFGKGTLTLRTMLSFEPATVSDRRYPELFQEGETAFGRPVVDGQHPHDFFMELAALYDYKISERTMLSVYAAPMGDPAMGPTAYPHRASASEDPIAPLGHHLPGLHAHCGRCGHAGHDSPKPASRGFGISWTRARRVPLEHQLREDGLVVDAGHRQSQPELERAIFRRAAAQPGGACSH